MPFSQIIPPFPSPSESISLLYTSVSLLLSRIRGHHYHLSKYILYIFLIYHLSYICVSILYWCFSFWLTSLCIISSSFIHLIRTDSNVFFNGWLIFHCVYVPQLSYPFICWWTSRLFPCPGYYKQCCNEYWGTCVSFNSGFLGVYAQQWDCWVIWQFYLQFFK